MILEDISVYDGSLIHNRFAYKFHRKKVLSIGNIVAFRASMKVEMSGMIDLEDLLDADFIYSDDAINFCWEIPNMCPTGAVAFQRLLNTGIANILASLIRKPIEMKGDDLMVHDRFIGSDKTEREVGKVSVSITYSKDGVAIGHTGININAGKKAPGFAYNTNLSDEGVKELQLAVIDYFNREVADIFVATSKVIV